MLGNVMDRGGHLVDCRGYLIGFALLTEHALAHILHARSQMRGTLIESACGLRNCIDHPLIPGLHGIERLGHLPDLIVTAVRHAGRQIAAFFDVQHHILERVELAEQKTDQQLRGAEHQQHQHENRGCVMAEAILKYLQEGRSKSQHRDLLAGAMGEDLRAAQ
ncbi:Unknown protein sequence [Pseudomonas savastanoi pv. phaseolicola]|nr:Unknown protein sequence [Pseudomonas savastanoi pv. phaseolicola]